MEFSAARREFSRAQLSEEEVSPHPIQQLNDWLSEARREKCPEPEAMHLSTAGPGGRPSGRIVLLRKAEGEKLYFFSNYESRKGHELQSNPQAALTFFWPQLERQVRLEGLIARATAEESLAYFRSRPPGSRLAAWASPQSKKLQSREVLEKAYQAKERVKEKYLEVCPPFWGGYYLQLRYAEFWQGRPSRLHDRLVYEKQQDGWSIGRLAP